jgi:hypothetical protein
MTIALRSFALAALALGGCSLVTPFGTFVIEGPDASADPDAASRDAGPTDAGSLDAGSLDAGSLDAGSLDAGVPDAAFAPDAGMPDASAIDASAATMSDAPFVAPDAFVDLDASAPIDAHAIDARVDDAFVPPDAAAPIDAAPTRHVVTLENDPAAGGTIVAMVAGRTVSVCSSARCDVLVDEGATLQLAATPSPLHRLSSWSRAGCLASLPCSFSVTAPETVRASWLRRALLEVVQSSGYPSGNVVEAWSPLTNAPLSGLAGCATGTGCTFEVDPGTRVRLSVTRTPRWQGVTSWSVAGCAGPTCDVMVGADTTVTIATGPLGHLAFVTSARFDGDLTGDPMPAAFEADAICQSIAIGAGFPGTYRAWLSSAGPGESVAARFAGAQGAWIRPDGTPFVASLADLLAARFLNPLAIDETGARYPDASAPWRWSNTRPDGAPFSTTASQTCSNFSVTSGTTALGVLGSSGSAGGDRWTAHPGFSQPCANSAALGCFQIDTVATPMLPGPRLAIDTSTPVFVSSATFTGSAGRAAMDAQCAIDATAAGLPGSYVALVGLSGSTALSRVARPFPWVRTDGWVAAQRVEEEDLYSPAILRADGTRASTPEIRTWTGSGRRLDTLDARTCSDWSSASASVTGAYGDVTGSIDWSGTSTAFCNAAQPVYCVRND